MSPAPRLDVDSSDAHVQIDGTTYGSETTVQGEAKQHIALGEEHVGPNGLEVGPIRRVLVYGKVLDPYIGFEEVLIENVTVLVVPDGPTNSPPVAVDDTATVAPGRSADID